MCMMIRVGVGVGVSHPTIHVAIVVCGRIPRCHPSHSRLVWSRRHVISDVERLWRPVLYETASLIDSLAKQDGYIPSETMLKKGFNKESSHNMYFDGSDGSMAVAR